MLRARLHHFIATHTMAILVHLGFIKGMDVAWYWCFECKSSIRGLREAREVPTSSSTGYCKKCKKDMIIFPTMVF